MESLAHYLVGLTLVLKGIDLAEHFNRHPFTVLFLFCAGAFIILNAVFHHRIEKHEPGFNALFHIAEGIFLIFIGLVLLEQDSRQPYFFFAVGAAYLALGYFELFRAAAAKKKLLRFFMTVLATVFLAAAAVALAVNLFGANDPWVYFTAGVLAVSGLFIVLAAKRPSDWPEPALRDEAGQWLQNHIQHNRIKTKEGRSWLFSRRSARAWIAATRAMSGVPGDAWQGR